jgi:hypothetical protein
MPPDLTPLCCRLYELGNVVGGGEEEEEEGSE